MPPVVDNSNQQAQEVAKVLEKMEEAMKVNMQKQKKALETTYKEIMTGVEVK